MAVLLLVIAANSVPYAPEFALTSPQTKYTREAVLGFGWEVFPALLLVFAMQFTGRDRYLTLPLLAVLCIVPCVTLAAALTNGAHHLFLSAYSVPADDLWLGLDRTFGPWFLAHVAYVYVLLAVATLVLLDLFRRSWSLYRAHAVALLVAILLPWVGDCLTMLGVDLVPGLDVGTIAFLVMALLMAYTVLRLRVSEVLAVSRTTILDSLQDAVMVLDGVGRVLYRTPSVRELLGRLAPEEDADARFASWPRDRLELSLGLSNEAELTITRSLLEKDTTYDVRLSHVFDAREQAVAHVLVARDVTEQLAVEQELRAGRAPHIKALDATVQALSAAVESRDPYTMGHQRRVAALAQLIAEELRLPADDIRGLCVAAQVHDVGEIGVPAEILSRPGRISAAELAVITAHAESGCQILKDVELPWPVAEIVRQRHEKLEGSGYPRGLRGDQISLAARILCVADVGEATASDRPYRASLGVPAALEEVQAQRGRLFDPDVVDVCLHVLARRGDVLPQA